MKVFLGKRSFLFLCMVVFSMCLLACQPVASDESDGSLDTGEDIVSSVESEENMTESVSEDESEVALGQVLITDVLTSSEESRYFVKAGVTPIASSDFSDEMYQYVAEDWEDYDPNAEGAERRLWRDGECLFDTWEEMTAFYGYEFTNPLEDCDELIFADNSALPLDTSSDQGKHCGVYWYSTKDNGIHTTKLTAGYLKDDIRVVLTILQYGDGAESMETGTAWAEEITFQVEDYTMKNGVIAAVVVPSATERYTSADGYFVLDNALYSISVTGDLGQEEDVREVLLTLLDLF